MITDYEWSFQCIDSNGDIIDHYFIDKLAEYPAWVRQLWVGGKCSVRASWGADCASHALELWRNTWEKHVDWPDLLNRSRARVEEGALPMHTDDGSIVPKRFHKEFMKWAQAPAQD
jgi:hypothetical protein